MVGKAKRGNGEKYRRPTANSGFLSRFAIGSDRKKRTREKTNPRINSNLFKLSTSVLPWPILSRGRKYAKTLGNPIVKTVCKVVKTYRICLNVPYSTLLKYLDKIAALTKAKAKLLNWPKRLIKVTGIVVH